jgi:hypothetical protein
LTKEISKRYRPIDKTHKGIQGLWRKLGKELQFSIRAKAAAKFVLRSVVTNDPKWF